MDVAENVHQVTLASGGVAQPGDGRAEVRNSTELTMVSSSRLVDVVRSAFTIYTSHVCIYFAVHVGNYN